MNLFCIQLRGELRKLFSRKRTYIGFGAFLVLEVTVLLLLQMPAAKGSMKRLIDGAGYDGASYLSGLTLAFMIMVSTVFLLGSLYLALVGGDVVGKEVEDGTLRMMLCRPASRGRILLLKIIAMLVYSVALTAFIALTALAAGLLHSGTGGLFAYIPAEKIIAFYEFTPGLWRYLVSVPAVTLSLLTVTCLAFFFSCMNIKPAAATTLTLSVLFVDTVLRSMPFFDSMRGWFLTNRMGAWALVFQPRIPWESLLESYTVLLAIDATLLILAAWIFQRRDFKS
jgi:ABC-2 type transport system permease protein